MSRYGSMSELCEDELLDKKVILSVLGIIRQGEVMD